MPRNHKYEMEIEIERGNDSVVYLVEFEVTPAERGTPRTMGDPGTPDYPACVEDHAVYFPTLKKCEDHRFTPAYQIKGCKACKTVKERRPELDCMVSEAEMLEYAGVEEEAAASAADDDAYDRWRDMQMERD